MSNDNESSQAIIPVQQETIYFRGLPLVLVRLPDGRPGVVLRWICENLGLASNGQIARIKRTEVIADDLITVQVNTEGGFQNMPTLVLNSIPYWLATIETRRMAPDDPKRAEILHYQKEAVAALFAWASSQKPVAAPSNLVPSQPIVEPTRPTPDAPLADWHDYYVRMAALLEWQMDVQHWQGGVESRLESLEQVTSIILEQMPAPTITPAHQNKVKYYVSQLSQATGQHRGTIYSALYTAFNVPRYEELLEAEWEQVERWFKTQLERKR